jgi:predicted Rdx family selenoprotein
MQWGLECAMDKHLSSLMEALTQDRWLDSKALYQRVLMRDPISSMWVLLAALIKGSDSNRTRILNAVSKEHFERSAFETEEIFDWITQSLRSRGMIDINYLHKNMEAYVRDEILPEYIQYLDDVCAVETPSEDEINRVLESLRNQTSSSADKVSERIVLAGLIKASPEMRKHIMDVIDPDRDIRHSMHADIFAWIMDLIQTKGNVDENDVYQAMEQHVRDRIAPTFTGQIDHLLAIETPDTELIDAAIANVQKRYVDRKLGKH